jgi:hypothetical protein
LLVYPLIDNITVMSKPAVTRFFQKYHLAYTRWVVTTSFTVFIGSILYLATIFMPLVFAATSPWTQTDWSGGQSDDLATGTVTTYKAISNLNATTAPGQISLTETSGWSGDYTAWQYRKKVTFDNTDANLGVTSESMTNFPVLVKLDSGSDIDYTKTKDSGEDIRFTDSDGTTLKYEIEYWNESGTSYVWVKVPQIDQNSSTDYVYMYYGNTDANDGQDDENVWDSNFLAVYHFDETTGSTLFDSTSNNVDATKDGSIGMDTSGQVDGADSFDGNGENYENTSAGMSFGTELTMEGWFKYPDGGAGSPRIVELSIQGNAYSHCLAPDPDGSVRAWADCNGTTYNRVGDADDSTDYGNDQWHYFVYTYSSPNAYIYMDGSRTDTGNVEACSNLDDGTILIIGAISDISGQYSHSQHEFDGDIDEIRISDVARSQAWIAATYKTSDDDFISYATEEERYPSSGTLTSNIFNAEFPADWGALTYNSTAPGTVTVKVRSDTNSDMSGATAWASCSAASSGSTLSDNDCVTNTDQYFQYQITLQPSGADSPIFQDITVNFSASDQIAPTTNASDIALTGLSDGNWTNTEPTITWTAGEDDPAGNGLLGYCVSLDEATIGSSSSLDPATAGGALTSLDDGVDQAYCPFIATGTSLDLSSVSGLTLTSNKQYYFSIKAVDLAGNIWSGSSELYQDLVSFKYDGTNPDPPAYISLPGDFVSTKEVTITWPTSGANGPSDDESGLAGLQYRIGSGGTWYGDSHTGTQDINDVLTNDGSYTTIEDPDFDDIEEGSNFIYFRSIDNVGNVSSTNVQGTLKVNTVAPSAPLNLTASPTTNTTNSFAFDWDSPTTYTGQVDNITYCYTINTLPSATSCAFTSAGTTALSADAYANQPGENTLYVVAKDEASNINYDTYAYVTFTANTSAPGIPQNIDIADVSVKATSSWKLAISWEEPASVGAGVQNYKIYHSTDASSYTLESTVTGISYVDTNLTQATHYYKVKACDSANNCGAFTAAVSLYPDGKFTEAAELTSDPTASNITTKRATITWSTDRTADSKVQYGTGSDDYYDEEPSTSEQETDHSITLTSLNPGTTYHYRAKWTDEDGNTGISDEFTFETDPAPTVTDVTAESIGISSANIKFTTEGASKVKIYYGESTSFGGISEISTSIEETTYTITLAGLNDGTKYYYKINTFDSENDEYDGTTLTFTTLPRPRISNVRIQQVKGTAQPTILITWETNTDISSIVTYYPQTNPAAAIDEVNVARTAGEHRMVIRGLLPHTKYALLVSGTDIIGNEAVSTPQIFTTATDTRPPSISSLKIEGSNIPRTNVSEKQQSQLVVSWDTDEPATSQVEFGEGTGNTYSQKTQEDSNRTFNHLVIVSGLTPSKVYHLRAISKDDAGNTTESIDTVTITPKPTDNAFDLVITNLQEAFGFLGGVQ